jgi:DNA topoisomerase-1
LEKELEALNSHIKFRKKEQTPSALNDKMEMENKQWNFPMDLGKAQELLYRLKDKLSNLKMKIREKDSLMSVALGTSKQNYLDPRITVAFAKRHHVPIDCLYSEALQKKFAWAFDAPADFRF